MIYTNKTLEIVEREFKFGKVVGVTLGESGRGRKEVFLPTPNGMKGLIEGMCSDATIGLSKSGRPRINRSNNKEIYVILSSARSYTRRGDGFIKVPASQNNDIVARGNGADGAAGRIGTWDVVVLKANEGDVFQVIWGGSGYGYEPTFYVVHDEKIYEADLSELDQMYEQIGLDVPFTLKYEEGNFATSKEEWKVV